MRDLDDRNDPKEMVWFLGQCGRKYITIDRVQHPELKHFPKPCKYLMHCMTHAFPGLKKCRWEYAQYEFDPVLLCYVEFQFGPYGRSDHLVFPVRFKLDVFPPPVIVDRYIDLACHEAMRTIEKNICRMVVDQLKVS